MDGGQDPLSGWFRDPEVLQHINYKETKALIETILVYHLQLSYYTESTTLWWYITKWGGADPWI